MANENTRGEWHAVLAGFLLGAQLVLFLTGHAQASNKVFLVFAVFWVLFLRRRKTPQTP
jgi:hypothetical protein